MWHTNMKWLIKTDKVLRCRFPMMLLLAVGNSGVILTFESRNLMPHVFLRFKCSIWAYDSCLKLVWNERQVAHNYCFISMIQAWICIDFGLVKRKKNPSWFQRSICQGLPCITSDQPSWLRRQDHQCSQVVVSFLSVLFLNLVTIRKTNFGTTSMDFSFNFRFE